tara:strand:+ start:1223 stop:1729 length:507 start_codon:yes stop_codon:yes gene_type:complete
VIIGVDNGLNGGLVAISKQTGAVIDKTVMPTLQRSKKRETDARKVYEWVMSLESDFIFAVEEPLHHARSSQAVRSMALSFGKLLGLAESRGWDVRCVKVHNWQKSMLGHLAPPYDTKKAALHVANGIAPEECWLKSKRCSKAHDGMVDAFLIARYIRKGYALVGYDKL